jgi:lipoyl-dependent peroxiredoxin
MPERSAKAAWKGTLLEGEGTMALGSGAFEGKFSFGSRMGEDPGTNPEELIGAALAGCYTMALNATLEKEGFKVGGIETGAKVHFGKDESGFTIRKIDLRTEASVEGINDDAFQEIAGKVKNACPVSKALTGTEIVLDAVLA